MGPTYGSPLMGPHLWVALVGLSPPLMGPPHLWVALVGLSPPLMGPAPQPVPCPQCPAPRCLALPRLLPDCSSCLIFSAPRGPHGAFGWCVQNDTCLPLAGERRGGGAKGGRGGERGGVGRRGRVLRPEGGGVMAGVGGATTGMGRGYGCRGRGCGRKGRGYSCTYSPYRPPGLHPIAPYNLP